MSTAKETRIAIQTELKKVNVDGKIQLEPPGETLRAFRELAVLPDDALWPPGVVPTEYFTGTIDINHDNDIDFATVWANGIRAIIHKGTEGLSFRDSKYHQRRKTALAMGFLWGAYHFSSGGNVGTQVRNFLDWTKPEDSDLIALDWEPSPGPDMTFAQAEEFCQTVKDKTGRYPVIYGGSLLREEIGQQHSAILSQCPLWYVIFREHADLIPAQVWPGGYALHQYTDGANGPQPRKTPGCHGADRNRFNGDESALREWWPGTRKA